MPRIPRPSSEPRRSSPTIGVPPEFMYRPSPRGPAPGRSAGPPEGHPEAPAARRRGVGLPRLSPHTYQPDEAQILRTLFGKEPDVDPHTGQLVYAPGQPAAPAALRHG